MSIGRFDCIVSCCMSRRNNELVQLEALDLFVDNSSCAGRRLICRSQTSRAAVEWLLCKYIAIAIDIRDWVDLRRSAVALACVIRQAGTTIFRWVWRNVHQLWTSLFTTNGSRIKKERIQTANEQWCDLTNLTEVCNKMTMRSKAKTFN